jgi:predicted O-methyltransferase YrrM
VANSLARRARRTDYRPVIVQHDSQPSLVRRFRVRDVSMLEKIGAAGFETLSEPNKVVMSYVDEILGNKGSITFYEIGVGVGATTLPVSKAISDNGGIGRIITFSRDRDVEDLISDLNEMGYDFVEGIGSPGKTYSGYHFEMAVAFSKSELPEFDLAYMDGGHVFHLDASATCILKELCKPSGYIIFDDYHWSLQKSPTLNPKSNPQTRNDYDQNQIDASHVELICKTLMNTDPRYHLVGIKNGSAIYKRLPRSVIAWDPAKGNCG